MKFEDIKPGMILRSDDDKNGERYWVIYLKESNAFHTYHYNIRKKDDGLIKVHVPKNMFNDPEYIWQEAKQANEIQIKLITKMMIREIFKYGIS